MRVCFLPRGYLRFEHELKEIPWNQDQSTEAFNIFRTLVPEDKPLQVKNEMWLDAKNRHEEAFALFDSNDHTSSSKSPRRHRKSPVIRFFFMPYQGDGGSISNTTLEMEGYCSDGRESDEDEGKPFDTKLVHQKRHCPLFSTRWKCELNPHDLSKGTEILSKDQQSLVKERHRLATLSALEMASGNECVSGYLLKLSKHDNNVWKKVHCVLPNNQQFWYVSRVKEIGPGEATDKNTITSRCIGRHGVIYLCGTLLIEEIDPKSKLAGIPCTFQLINKEGQTHTFRASSRNAYLRWMNCISRSIVQCQENNYFEMAEQISKSS